MAEDPTSNPRGPIPATNDSSLGELGFGAGASLVECLGEVADDLRQIGVDFGLRPYTVHVVRIRWSGGEIGRGTATTALDLALSPTPKVNGIGSAMRELMAGGSLERGDVRLTGVSPRYTEDEIDTYFATAGDGEEVFVEIRIDERDGPAKRRRYVLARPPERRPDKFDWLLVLRRQDGDRLRDSTPRAERPRVW